MRILSPIVSPLDGQRVVGTPVELSADYTVQLSDANQSFSYNGTGTITVTFPATLPDGFKAKVYNCGLGQVVFVAPSTVHFGNAQRLGLIFQWDVADIQLLTISSTRIFMTIYNLALPVLYGESNAALTRNVTAMSAIPGISIPLETNASYDIDLLVSFTSAITTNTLKLGFLALPSGAKCQLEGRFWNTATKGTAPVSNVLFTTSAQLVTGDGGTAAVTGVTMLGRIFGRIRTGATAGSLVPTAGALATTGNVSVAAGDATLSVSKVFDLGRT